MRCNRPLKQPSPVHLLFPMILTDLIIYFGAIHQVAYPYHRSLPQRCSTIHIQLMHANLLNTPGPRTSYPLGKAPPRDRVIVEKKQRRLIRQAEPLWRSNLPLIALAARGRKDRHPTVFKRLFGQNRQTVESQVSGQANLLYAHGPRASYPLGKVPPRDRLIVEKKQRRLEWFLLFYSRLHWLRVPVRGRLVHLVRLPPKGAVTVPHCINSPGRRIKSGNLPLNHHGLPPVPRPRR